MQRVDRQGIRDTKARERAIATSACAATSNTSMHANVPRQWHASSCGEWHATSARQGLVNATRPRGKGMGTVLGCAPEPRVCSRAPEHKNRVFRSSVFRSSVSPLPRQLPSVLYPDNSRQSIANHYSLPYPTDAAAYATYAVTQIVTKKLTRGLA